jgi:hypothetical protein
MSDKSSHYQRQERNKERQKRIRYGHNNNWKLVKRKKRRWHELDNKPLFLFSGAILIPVGRLHFNSAHYGSENNKKTKTKLVEGGKMVGALRTEIGLYFFWVSNDDSAPSSQHLISGSLKWRNSKNIKGRHLCGDTKIKTLGGYTGR